jgi:hypothetical protein
MDEETLRLRAKASKRAAAQGQAVHDALVDAIWEAVAEGMQQVKIVKATNLTRERIRQLCDADYRKRAMERRQKRTRPDQAAR